MSSPTASFLPTRQQCPTALVPGAEFQGACAALALHPAWFQGRSDILVDVDVPRSELHERYAFGVAAQDGYFSIDTGKFTCASSFASHLLDALDA